MLTDSKVQIFRPKLFAVELGTRNLVEIKELFARTVSNWLFHQPDWPSTWMDKGLEIKDFSFENNLHFEGRNCAFCSKIGEQVS